ncbi:MAG: hypothetical protein WCF67_23825 [Chitinophagaceae bacterium]
MICSCNAPEPVKTISLFDTTLEKHVRLYDSSDIYADDPHYRLLRAYIKKDTAYFNEANKEIRMYEKYQEQASDNMEDWYCVPPDPLTLSKYDEAYKIQIQPSFYHNQATITVYRKDKMYYVHFIESGFTILDHSKKTIDDNDSCRIFFDDTIQIDESRWNNLLMKIRFADFWKLLPFKDEKVLDGSSWKLEGMRRSYDQNNKSGYEKHVVIRHSPDNTAIGEIGKYMLEISEKKQLFNLYYTPY